MVRRSSLVAGALLVAAGAGCASQFAALPVAEQQLYEKCRKVIVKQRCSASDSGDVIHRDVCKSTLQRQYSTHSTPGARKRWLVESGCAKEIVGLTKDDGGADDDSSTDD